MHALIPGRLDCSNRHVGPKSQETNEVYVALLLLLAQLPIAEALLAWNQLVPQAGRMLSKFAFTSSFMACGRQLVMRSISSRTTKVVTLSGPT
jgi:hypothetical protein